MMNSKWSSSNPANGEKVSQFIDANELRAIAIVPCDAVHPYSKD